MLLDTTVLIDVLRARQNRRVLLAELVTAGHTLVTASINIAEVYAGMPPQEEEMTERFLSGLECHLLNGDIARRAGALKADLARKGQTLALADMIVAAIALQDGLTLMTDHRQDFPIPEVRFYSFLYRAFCAHAD